MGGYSVTAALVAWLKGLGYRASTSVPADRPDEFVTVERTGGGVSDMLDHPVVAIGTWAATEFGAEQMGRDIRSAALAGPRPEGVHSMRVDAGPYALGDAERGIPRYQLVLDITCRI